MSLKMHVVPTLGADGTTVISMGELNVEGITVSSMGELVR